MNKTPIKRNMSTTLIDDTQGINFMIIQ